MSAKYKAFVDRDVNSVNIHEVNEDGHPIRFVCAFGPPDEEAEEDAAKVVVALDSHDALLEALENLIFEIDSRSLAGRLDGNSALVLFVNAGRLAIAKAKGGAA